MLSLNERKHLSSTFNFDPRPKPSSPTLLPKGEGSKLSKYMAQTPTDFNFLIREVCQHPFKAGLKIQALLRDEAELLTALIESSVLLHFKLESTPCRRNTELRNSRSSLPSSRKRHANRAEYQK